MALTVDPRALIYGPDGIEVRTLPCEAAVADARAYAPANPAPAAIDPAAIRVVTWNIHKEDDAGWQDDLTRFARDHDILLLQEVTLIDEIRDILHAAGMRWVMASSFLYKDTDIGVLTADARGSGRALHAARGRAAHPAAEVVGRDLVPAQGIGQDARRRQRALDQLLAARSTSTKRSWPASLRRWPDHDGPIIFAGDLNTWTDARLAAVHNVASRAAPRGDSVRAWARRGFSAGRSTTSWCAA